MPPPVSILEAHGEPINGLHMGARSGDHSTVAVASTLASLSNLSNKLSLLSSSSHDGEDVEQGSEIPSVPSACEVSDNCVVDTGMNNASTHNDHTSASVIEKNGTPSPDITNENLNINDEIGKMAGENNDMRPVLHYLSSSTAPVFDISGNLSKILDEHRVPRDQSKASDATTSSSSRHQDFKDGLQKGLMDCNDIDVSFEDFPYYLRLVLVVIVFYVIL